MPKYEYEAVNPTTRTRHKGVVEAPTMEEALQRLVARKIFPSYFAEMSSTQVDVAKRIANYKKLTRTVAPEVVEEPLVIPPKQLKFSVNWTYVMIAVAVVVLVLWAVGARV
jgi:hypothetical protein